MNSGIQSRPPGFGSRLHNPCCMSTLCFRTRFFDLGSLEWAYTVLANEEGNVTICRERHQRLRSFAAPLSYTDCLNLKDDILPDHTRYAARSTWQAEPAHKQAHRFLHDFA